MAGAAVPTKPAPGLYADPFGALSSPVPKRIDQGVDMGGSGPLLALARGVVEQADASGSGWPGGGYVRIAITQPGPLLGQHIYYAENITPLVKVGQTVNAGEPVATLHNAYPFSETGFAAGNINQTYAAAHGGYTEGLATPAGEAFNRLVLTLGGPSGTQQPVGAGSAPNIGGVGDYTQTGPGGNNPLLNIIGAPAGIAQGAFNAGKSAVDVAATLANFVSNPVPALLTIMLVGLGAALVYSGAGKLLGFDQPLRSTAQRAGRVAQTTLKAVPA